MDLNVNNTDWLSRAMKPTELKDSTKKWRDIKSYIYIVQKEFNPYSDHSKYKKNQGLNKRMNLVKIGYSSVSTKDHKEKGFQRVFGLRTALVSLNIHRAYLYTTYQPGDGKKYDDDQSAHVAEQALHKIVMREYEPKPPIFRIHFRNETETEWFSIPQKDMQKFLAFCDDKIFNSVTPICLYGTAFKPRSAAKVEVEVLPQYTGVRYDAKEKQLVNKEELRKMAHEASKNAKTLRQRKTDLLNIQSDMQKKAELLKDRKKHTHTRDFWLKIFKDKTFTTKKKMWDGDYTWKKYPHKIISDVVWDSSNRQWICEYEVDADQTSKRLYDRMRKEQKLNAEGFLSINETFDEFPKLKTKYKKEYD